MSSPARDGRRDAGDGEVLMATTITMPQLGETVTEGTVAQWLKSVGDTVDKYEDFVEVSTDKVNAGVPSPVTGTIRELLVKEGETVATGTPIAVIDEVGAAAAPRRRRPRRLARARARRDAAARAASPQRTARPQQSPTAEADGALRGASPAVRRLAREHHVDIRALKGSGANGRVTADDVLAAARGGAVAPPPARRRRRPHHRSRRARRARPPTRSRSRARRCTLTQARRIIAERMVESRHTAPHAWSMVEIDVTDVWKWRVARERSLRARDRLQADAAAVLHSRGRRIARRVSADERALRAGDRFEPGRHLRQRRGERRRRDRAGRPISSCR